MTPGEDGSVRANKPINRICESKAKAKCRPWTFTVAVASTVLLAPACGYREIRYELGIEDPPPGGGGVQQAQVVDMNQRRQLRAEQVGWRFEGVLAAGPRPGTFTATGPGTGSVEAVFLTPDGTRSMAIGLVVRPRPGRPAAAKRPTPEPIIVVQPTPSPQVELAPAPTPTPTPSNPSVVVREPTDGERVLEAYRLADQGKFSAALEELAAIHSPDFGPKVQALSRQWAPQAAAELAAQAERLAAEGKVPEALASARKGLQLAPTADTRRRLEAVEARLSK